MTRVAVGYVHDYHGGSHSYEQAYRYVRDYDAMYGRVIRREIPALLSKVDGIAAARNEICRQFLAAGDCDWLWMVDRDMGFRPDALHRLLSAADPVKRPIVGALCFAAWAGEQDGMHGWRVDPVPTIYRWRDDLPGGRGLATLNLYPVDMVIQVDATGAAFLLIHRTVLETLGAGWFTPSTDPAMGEDFSFCVRAGQAGFPLHVHTGVKTTHAKMMWLSELDYWRQYNAPPATADTAVIVPEMRPEHAGRFLSSLIASTGRAEYYDPGTDVDSLTEPWVFLTGDDVTFTPGWLDQAQHVADSYKAEVVQVNGRGVLARRELVAKYFDDWAALVADAKERGVFQVALAAVVEVDRGEAEG